MINEILYAIIGILGVILPIVVVKLRRLKEDLLHNIEVLTQTSLLLAEARMREVTTNQQVQDIFIKVAPLLEQTDWMTGRWGGQFQTLVGMENARNRQAVDLRRKLLALPYLQEYVSYNSIGLLKGGLAQGLAGIEKGHL